MRIYDAKDEAGNLKPLVEILGDWAWAAMGLILISEAGEGFIEGLIEGVQKSV